MPTDLSSELESAKQRVAELEAKVYADQYDGGEIARKVLGITKGENDGN
jgi:hypothetical protein